jgi:hypothetical protein
LWLSRPYAARRSTIQSASPSKQWRAPNVQSSSTDAQLLASISAQRAFTFSRFCFATSLFFAVRSSLSARRHMFTSCLRVVHMPIVFHMKPLAWHSSRAVMISSQPGRQLLEKAWIRAHHVKKTHRHCPWCAGEDAWWLVSAGGQSESE